MANVIYSMALLLIMTAQSERLAAMETEEFQKALTTDTYEEVLPPDGLEEVARMPGHAASPCEGDGPCDSNKSQEVETDTSLQEVHDSRTTVNTSQVAKGSDLGVQKATDMIAERFGHNRTDRIGGDPCEDCIRKIMVAGGVTTEYGIDIWAKKRNAIDQCEKKCTDCEMRCHRKQGPGVCCNQCHHESGSTALTMNQCDEKPVERTRETEQQKFQFADWSQPEASYYDTATAAAASYSDAIAAYWKTPRAVLPSDICIVCIGKNGGLYYDHIDQHRDFQEAEKKFDRALAKCSDINGPFTDASSDCKPYECEAACKKASLYSELHKQGFLVRSAELLESCYAACADNSRRDSEPVTAVLKDGAKCNPKPEADCEAANKRRGPQVQPCHNCNKEGDRNADLFAPGMKNELNKLLEEKNQQLQKEAKEKAQKARQQEDQADQLAKLRFTDVWTRVKIHGLEGDLEKLNGQAGVTQCCYDKLAGYKVWLDSDTPDVRYAKLISIKQDNLQCEVRGCGRK